MQIKLLITVLLTLAASAVFGDEGDIGTSVPLIMQHPFYAGFMTGYGNTDWSELVSQDDLSALATPTQASGGGAIIGGLVGYQITQYIALEAQYVRYPNSELTFLLPNPVYPNLSGPVVSHTNYYAIMPKVMAPFDQDHFAAFGTLGAAMVTRSDVLANIHDYRPTFGFGVSDIQWTHWNLTLAFNYTPGTGVASEETSAQYIPYLYAGEFIISYRI